MERIHFSLTFQDPDNDEEIGVDTQADDFRFDFTIQSQNFGGNFGGLASQTNQFGDSKVKDNISLTRNI